MRTLNPDIEQIKTTDHPTGIQIDVSHELELDNQSEAPSSTKSASESPDRRNKYINLDLD